ncbi:MAG TPA: nuclear transport factor 2 family protein [Candidatus Eisenbacteria bacterium]|nr:nuclear transport factor 2 family protein [Candidatus Eisenbacteria bacterium]
MATQTIDKELLELERSYWQAMKDQDTATVLRLTADPCLVAGAQGVSVVKKESLADIMKSKTYELQDFELKDVQSLKVRDDVVILGYKVREKLLVEGKPVTLDASETSTWIRQGNQWVCTHHTEAISGDSFGRDRVPRP